MSQARLPRLWALICIDGEVFFSFSSGSGFGSAVVNDR